MKITKEQKQEILREWNKIGENDCHMPSWEITELLYKILNSVTR